MSRFALRLQRAHHDFAATAPISAYSDEVLADSPQLYYAMQDQATTVMTDSSGSSQHGTYIGGTTVDYASNRYNYAPVALGRHTYLYNDATNDQYASAPATSLDLSAGFSFECWYYWMGWNYNTVIFSIDTAIAFGHVYQQPQYVVRVGGTELTWPEGTSNEWHHLAVNVSAGGGTATVYVDNVQVASGAVGSMSSTGYSTLYLGMNPAGGNYYRGYLTQVAVYGQVLSPTRVAAHYQAGQADADPVWHGPPEHYDLSYYNAFTGATPLANPSFVMVADWEPAEMWTSGEVAAMAPYINTVVNPDGEPGVEVDYQWYRDSGLYLMPATSRPAVMTGTRGSETIGYFIDDEADMSGDEGMTRMQANAALVPSGYLGYANFGNYVTMGMGGGSYEPADFVNYPGVDIESTDLYFYSQDTTSTIINNYLGIDSSQYRRACNYGLLVERHRSLQSAPRPLGNYVELGHPYNSNESGGPNPDQVEGAVWASIIGGARMINYFHHSFPEMDTNGAVTPPAWVSTTDYREGQCVEYGGVWYYAALKPTIGQVPDVSSYTWVRFSGSDWVISDFTNRHPDLSARLIKIKNELETLAPAINAASVMHLLHRDIYSVYRVGLDSNHYIIALPDLSAPNGGTFDMYLPVGQTPSSIEVMFESRSITPFSSGGRLKFTDTFAAEYSHHIYRW